MRIGPTITVAMVKAEAARRLAQTDWVVLRAMESGKAAPEAILRGRATIRARSNEIEADLPPDYKADWRWQ